MELKEGYVITTEEIKEKILKNNDSFKEYIFLTLADLKHKLNFQVKNKAVFALMQKYSFSYDLAKEYIEAIYLIEDKTYNNPKLDSIVSSYRFLKENNCLINDELFKYRLKQYPLTFIDPEDSKEYVKIKDQVSKLTQVYEYQLNNYNYKPIVYEHKTIIEECLFVFNKIVDLLNSGVSLNKIFILNADDSYQFIFKRLAKHYQISLNFKPTKNILSSETIKEFLNLCLEKDDFKTVIETLNSNAEFYNEIIDIINDYELNKENPKTCIELLKNIFKNKSYPQKQYIDAVSFVSDSIVLNDDEYAFLVNFNLGSAPIVQKEAGFLNDNDLTILNVDTSIDKNFLATQKLKKFILGTKNVFITYKLFVNTEEYLPSPLIAELGLDVIKNEPAYGYSKVEDDLRLLSSYEKYLKYGDLSADILKYGLNNTNYKGFDHKYKKLDAEVINKHFKDKKLKLAYSNVKLYFACPFSYYADRILNLNEFKPQMAARMGTFAHAVLEDSYKGDFNFDNSVIKNHLENRVDAKDDFFFSQMTDVLRDLIAFNREHEDMMQLKDVKREEHIVIEKDNFIFEGYIDKMLYTIQGNDVYVAIIDYKTGKDVVSLDNVADGFHLQLPSYMYLLDKYAPFKGLNLHIIGLYLQKVNIVIFDNKSSLDKQMNKRFMLEGYTVMNPALINLFDPTYAASTYIKSLGLTKDGFRSYSKIYQESKQKEIVNMVENLLDTAAEGILKADFTIAPKVIKDKNESCIFCKYRDLCFCDYEDNVELSYKPFGKEVN